MYSSNLFNDFCYHDASKTSVDRPTGDTSEKPKVKSDRSEKSESRLWHRCKKTFFMLLFYFFDAFLQFFYFLKFFIFRWQIFYSTKPTKLRDKTTFNEFNTTAIGNSLTKSHNSQT